MPDGEEEMELSVESGLTDARAEVSEDGRGQDIQVVCRLPRIYAEQAFLESHATRPPRVSACSRTVEG